MTHEEMQGYVNQTDKIIELQKQVGKSIFLIESVLILQGGNLTAAAYRALCMACNNLKTIYEQSA